MTRLEKIRMLKAMQTRAITDRQALSTVEKIPVGHSEIEKEFYSRHLDLAKQSLSDFISALELVINNITIGE